MSIKLIRKGQSSKWSDKEYKYIRDEGNMFFEYAVAKNACVMFEQELKTGNIYSVKVGLPRYLVKAVSVYVHSSNQTFYPNKVSIEIRNSYYPEELDELADSLKEIKEICNDVMQIFEKEEHKSLWKGLHKI